MNYLDLINAVLVRLRENKASAATLDSNPFFAVIGATVNDAKEIVEDSWDWSGLRGCDETFVVQGQSIIQLPNSADSHYRLREVQNLTSGTFLKQVTPAQGAQRYADELTNPIGQQDPLEYFHCNDYWNPSDDADLLNGTKQIRLMAPSTATFTIGLVRIAHQPLLTNWDQKIRVPSAPVYTLATALASRERGDIGGAPTGELFALAQKSLSDAIAIDSARYPEELIWYTPSNESQGNWA